MEIPTVEKLIQWKEETITSFQYDQIFSLEYQQSWHVMLLEIKESLIDLISNIELFLNGCLEINDFDRCCILKEWLEHSYEKLTILEQNLEKYESLNYEKS